MQVNEYIGLHCDSKPIKDLVAAMDPRAVLDSNDGIYSYTILTAGCDLVFDEHLCLRAVFLYRDCVEGHKQYSGELPMGLHFGDKRDELRALLGEPAESAEATRYLGYDLPAWDKYMQSNYALQLRFSDTTRELCVIVLDALAP